MTTWRNFCIFNYIQVPPETLHYPPGDTANGFVVNVYRLLNITCLTAVGGPSVQKGQMLANPKVHGARLRVPNIMVLSSD